MVVPLLVTIRFWILSEPLRPGTPVHAEPPLTGEFVMASLQVMPVAIPLYWSMRKISWKW